MSVLNDVGLLKSTGVKYVWEIKNFKDYNIVGLQIASPTFSTISSNNVIYWRLKCCPMSEDGGVPLFLENSSDVGVQAKFQVFLLNYINDTKYFSCPSRKEVFLKYQSCNVTKLNRNYIISEKSQEITGGYLKILCEISNVTLLDPTVTTGMNDWKFRKDYYRIREFDDFEKLLDSKESSDVTFVVEGKEIFSHKAILGVRSPVFQAMFQHDMKEKEENLVKIDDTQYDIMKEVFRFIYTAKVNDIEDKVNDLFVAADKYSITGLKDLCERTLNDNLSVDNAVEYLNLSAMCNAISLKWRIIGFIINDLDIISQKPEFKLLHSEVMYDIIRAIAEKKANK